jgi:hypothetical protein
LPPPPPPLSRSPAGCRVDASTSRPLSPLVRCRSPCCRLLLLFLGGGGGGGGGGRRGGGLFDGIDEGCWQGRAIVAPASPQAQFVVV